MRLSGYIPEPSNSDLSAYSIRTDLAIEAHQAHGKEIPGVKVETREEDGITISRVKVETLAGAKTLGKMPGYYVTLEVPGLRQKDPELQERVTTHFIEEFSAFIHHYSKKALVLVVGLGNWNVTPDALGPLVVENLFVSRHLFTHMPHLVEEGYRPVAAVSPGVLGITGIETSEIVQGIVEKVKPSLVIAIDALATRSLDRVNTTIQISDTGINPGSGVGNRRKGLTADTLGVPVIAIGVPTVVAAAEIARNAIDLLIKRLDGDVPGNDVGKLLRQFDETQMRQLLQELLEPYGNNLMVTPKEVDEFVEDIANVVANGLNAALHPAIHEQNAAFYTH
jgi:spore protease